MNFKIKDWEIEILKLKIVEVMVVMFVIIVYIIGDFFGVLCFVFSYFIFLNYIELFGSGLDFSVFCYIFVCKGFKGML